MTLIELPVSTNAAILRSPNKTVMYKNLFLVALSSKSALIDVVNPEDCAPHLGGSADILINEVTKDQNLKSIDRASRGDWGGTNIDKKYMKLLEEVLGNNIMEEIRRDYSSTLLEIQQDFEEHKRKITSDRDHDVVIRLPGGVMEAIRNKKQKLADIVESSPHASTVSVKENQINKLHIRARIFVSFFTEATQHIISHLQKVLDNRNLGHIPPAMVIVGGFSESLIIKEAIRNHPSFKNIKIIIPIEANLAVLKGAVLFGHNPNVVISRMAKYSYGIRTERAFKIGDPSAKMYKEGGKEWCKDNFQKLFTINEEVSVGKKSSVTIKESYKDQKRQAKRTMPHILDVYMSTEANPNFIDEQSCLKLGHMQIPPPDGKQWPMEWTGDFELEIGESELVGRFKNRKSKETSLATFNMIGVPFYYN
ncbi:heat shock 70 kDa protein 12B-like [Mytilus edulis]|uniref:heat shock 70 kDa protein 12B-like n=1 Tax=Mytilus edulis TaxID=6550 RepID=UPI0039F0B746